MHLTEVAPVTQIRPLRPVAAAVQTSSAVKTAELQTQFVDRGCSCWADRLAEAMLMLIDVRFVFCRLLEALQVCTAARHSSNTCLCERASSFSWS